MKYILNRPMAIVPKRRNYKSSVIATMFNCVTVNKFMNYYCCLLICKNYLITYRTFGLYGWTACAMHLSSYDVNSRIIIFME